MALVDLDAICRISGSILRAAGVDEKDAGIIADSIVYAHRAGVPSHGIGRLPIYLDMLEKGWIKPNQEVEEVSRKGAVLLLDAGHGFGQTAACQALERGAQLAALHSLALVGVRNSNNFGTASYFGRMAAERGLICLIFANAAPAMAPPGGGRAIMGTNPLCIALPGSTSRPPLVLDMAMTVAARGKIRQAARLGQMIPDNWALDSEGKATRDPHEALKGSLFPMGGYKGFALSLMVDALAGMLTGSAFGGQVLPLSDPSGPSRNGHMFILARADAFMDQASYERDYDHLLDSVQASGEGRQVHLPGDSYQVGVDKGVSKVDLADATITSINDLAHKMKVNDQLN